MIKLSSKWMNFYFYSFIYVGISPLTLSNTMCNIIFPNFFMCFIVHLVGHNTPYLKSLIPPPRKNICASITHIKNVPIQSHIYLGLSVYLKCDIRKCDNKMCIHTNCDVRTKLRYSHLIATLVVLQHLF